MKILILFAATLAASPIQPVWQNYPGFSPICDGFEIGLPPWGCSSAEIRYLTSFGEVRILSIPAVASFDLSRAHPAPVTPGVREVAPEWQAPDVAGVPEPSYGILIAIVGLANAAVYRWRNR